MAHMAVLNRHSQYGPPCIGEVTTSATLLSGVRVGMEITDAIDRSCNKALQDIYHTALNCVRRTLELYGCEPGQQACGLRLDTS